MKMTRFLNRIISIALAAILFFSGINTNYVYAYENVAAEGNSLVELETGDESSTESSDDVSDDDNGQTGDDVIIIDDDTDSDIEEDANAEDSTDDTSVVIVDEAGAETSAVDEETIGFTTPNDTFNAADTQPVSVKLNFPKGSFMETVDGSTDITVYFTNVASGNTNYAYLQLAPVTTEDTMDSDYVVEVSDTINLVPGNYYISYYISSNVTTNLHYDRTIYVTNDGFSLDSSDRATIAIENSVTVPLLKARVAGKVSLPDEYHTTDPDENRRLYIYAKTTSGSTYSTSVLLSENNPEKYYQINSLPLDAEEIESLYVTVNSGNQATAVAYGSNEYLCIEKEDSYSSYLTADASKASAFNLTELKDEIDNGLLDFELMKTPVKYTISLPENVVRDESKAVTGTVYNYYSSGSRYTYNYFKIPAGEKEFVLYADNYPLTAGELSGTGVKVDGNDNNSHNLVTGSELYYSQGKLISTKTMDGSELSSDSTYERDITLRTSPVKAVVRLPENATVGANTSYVSGSFKYNDGVNRSRDFRIYPDEKECSFYLNEINPDAANLKNVNIYLYNSNGNIVSGISEYYDGTVTPVHSNPGYTHVIPANSATTISMCAWVTPLSVNVKLPEDAIIPENVAVKGSVYVYYDGNKNTETSFTIPYGEDSAKVLMSGLPADVTEISYVRVRVNSFNGISNLTYGRDEYCAADGTMVSSKDNAASFAITEDTMTVTLAKTPAHIKLKLGSDAIFRGNDLKGTFYLKNSSNSSFSKDIVISEGEDSVEFYLNDYDFSNRTIKETRVRWYDSSKVITNIYLNDYLYYNGSSFSTVNPGTYNYELPASGQIKEFTVDKSKNVVPVKFSLPSGSRVYGQRLSGYAYVYYVSQSSGTNRSGYFFLEPGETEVTGYVTLPDNYNIPGNVYGIKYNLSKNNNVGTDVICDKDFWYNGTTCQTTAYRNAMYVSGTTPVSIVLSAGKAVSGKIVLPEGTFLKNSPLTGTIYVRCDSSYTYQYNFTVPVDATEVPYCISLPDERTNVNYIKVYIPNNNNASTNIVTGSDMFLGQNGAVFSESQAASFALNTTGMTTKDITVAKYGSVSGKFTLPGGAYLTDYGNNEYDGSVTVTAYDENNRSFSQTIRIYGEDLKSEYEYQIAIKNYSSAKIKNIAVRFNTVNSNIETDIAKDQFYLTEDGTLVKSQYELTTLSLTDKNDYHINFGFQKVPTLSGKIKLPENAFLGGDQVKVTVYATCYGQSFSGGSRVNSVQMTLSGEEKREYDYKLPLLLGTESVKDVYAYVSNVSNSNIYAGYSYRISNSESFTSSEGQEIAVSGNGVRADITLITLYPVHGTLTIPDMYTISGGKLNARISCANGYDSTGRSVDVSFDNDNRTAEYTCLLPVNSTSLWYISVYLTKENSSVETDVVLQRNLFVDGYGTWISKYQGIEPIISADIPANIDLTYPTPKTISGSVSIEDIGYIRNGSLTFKIGAFTDADNYESDAAVSTDYVLDAVKKTVNYSIELPLFASKVNYLFLEGSFDGGEDDCNLVLATKKCYVGSDSSFREDPSLCAPIQIQNNTAHKDIVLEATRKIGGKIVLPEGTVIDGQINGVISFSVGGYVQNREFTLRRATDELTYETVLPSGARKIDTVSVQLSGSDSSNLVMGTMYYNATSGRWLTSSLNAEGFDVLSDYTNFDVELQRRVTLSGDIELPEGAYFSGAELNGYVRADIGAGSAVGYFAIEPGETGSHYEINIPAEAETVDSISIFVYPNSILDSNILTGQLMYLTEQGWAENNGDALSITRNGTYDLIKDLMLPISCTVSGTISREDTGVALEGTVTVHNSGSEYTTIFRLEEDEYSTTYRISLPDNNNTDYKLSYDISTQDVEGYCTDEVFVNLDGSYALSEDFCENAVLATINSRDIVLATWDSFTETVLLESPHPYTSDGTYTMIYEYPGTADGLEITFSRNTHFEEGFDDFYLLDGDDNQLVAFSGHEAAGRTVTVPVTKVKFVIDADVSNPSYGFGICSIKAINGVLPSDLAASTVYENDIATYAVIHKNDEAQRNFYMSVANYDESGKMLSSVNKKVGVEGNMSVVPMELEPNENSSVGKLMLYNEKLAPLMTAAFKVFAAYSVTFHYNDDVDTTRVVYVAENNKVARPSVDPSREGYQFVNWYKDPEFTTLFDFGEPLVSSAHAYAKWQKLYEVITDITGNGTIVSEGLNGIYALSGQQIVLTPDPEEGAVYSGWKIESGLNNDEYTIDETGKLTFVMPEKDVLVRLTFADEVDITWLESSVLVQNEGSQEKEMRLPYEHKLIVPSEYDKVTLKGKVPSDRFGFTSVTYTYSYFSRDENDAEIYVNGEEQTLAYDAEGVFTLNDLTVNPGSNALSFRFIYPDGSSSTLDYVITGVQDNITLKDGVNEMDLYDMTDMAFVEDLATGIEAYWGTEDGFTVLIVSKQSEIAQRVLLDEEDERHIGIGSVWVIPCCDQFPTGYTFKIMDIGNSEYAPEAPAGDVYENVVFSSDKYIYILAGSPELSEIFGDPFSVEMKGIDGIAFTLLPDNSVMNFDIEQEDGSSVMATSGSFSSPGDVTRKGFQYQNLARNIIPKASINSNKVGLTLQFADTVLYDKDGSKNTKWDQLSLGGSLNIKDLGIEGAFEWHPRANLNPWDSDFGIHVLPEQLGMLVDYTFTQSVKVQIGGVIGGDADAEPGHNNAWSLSDIVKSAREDFGTGDNSKKKVDFLCFKADIEGNNMNNTIVLAAVGFDVGTMCVVPGTYDQISIASTFSGLAPVLCLMFVMDVDGSISGKITYQYSKTSYHANGFNITKNGFRETNAKIKKQSPVYNTNVVGYEVEVFSTTQASESDRSEAVGKHTISVNAEAKFDFGFGPDVALLVSGLNIAQVKGGVYLESSAGATGSVVLQKGCQPDFSLDGYVKAAVGLMVQFSSKLIAKINGGDVGWDVVWDKKWEIDHWGLSSIGISGTITTPSLMDNVADKGLEGVEVILSPINPATTPLRTTTDRDGKYSFKNLPANTSYKVELKKDGYVQKKEVTADERIDVGTTSVKKKNFSMAKALYFGLSGGVIAADSRTKIAGASVMLTNLSNSSVKYAITDANGVYKIGKSGSATEGLTPAYYKMVVSANGYKTVSKKILINQTTEALIHIDDVQMIRGAGDEDCTITGYIYDLATGASTGAPLKLYLRSGLDNTSGRILKTYVLEDNGLYVFNVPVGNYTIQVKDERKRISDDQKYITTNFNVIASNNYKDQKQNGYVSTNSSTDQVRIVLTWGENPRDLDSHLIGPDAKGTGKFHTYYSNKVYSHNGVRFDDLDLDDTTSYGPETTTIYKKSLYDKYSYYVHDYTNRSSTSCKEMSLSNATVKVYIGSQLMATYRVPKNTTGTVWHVFDYNPVTNALIEKGRMFNQSDPGKVGMTTASADSEVIETSYEDYPDDERENLEIIFSDLEEKE